MQRCLRLLLCVPFVVLAMAFAHPGSAVAATAAYNCGHPVVRVYRSLSSAQTTTKLHSLCAKAQVSYSKVNFIKHHRAMIAPKYAKWWLVPDKKWRQLVRKSRASLRKNQAALSVLSQRIEKLQIEALKNFDGYMPPAEARMLGQTMASQWGWTEANGQWQCLDELWGTKNGRRLESGWYMRADNPRSDAYGIPQALPGSKMGARWKTSVWVQINWGLGYIKGKFKTPCSALTVRLAQGSY